MNFAVYSSLPALTLWASIGTDIVYSSVTLALVLVSDAGADEPVVVCSGVLPFARTIVFTMTGEAVVIGS